MRLSFRRWVLHGGPMPAAIKGMVRSADPTSSSEEKIASAEADPTNSEESRYLISVLNPQYPQSFLFAAGFGFAEEFVGAGVAGAAGGAGGGDGLVEARRGGAEAGRGLLILRLAQLG